MGKRELTLDAKIENLNQVLAFLDRRLDELECSMKAKMQIELALEEIFVNVSSYAYNRVGPASQEPGKVSISVEDTKDPLSVAVTIIDRGIPFNPLTQQDPDVSLPAEDRRVGGLGIYMVKKSMDHVRYEFKDGQNILTFRKDL